ELIEKGSDVIKTWEGLTAEDYVGIVREAHKRGIKVHSHLYEPEDIRLAIDGGVDVLQHMGSAGSPRYEAALLEEIARKKIPVVQTISHRIWVYPATLEFPGRLDNPKLARYIPPHIYAELQRSFADITTLPYFSEIETETRNSKTSAAQFIETGAFMGVGTDAASPLNFHTEAMWREMSALVDLGMTPIQVISAATKNGAEIIGNARQLGTLEPGKLADLIVVEGSPLEDNNMLKFVRATVRDGVPWYDPQQTVLPGLAEVGRSY
ncbi:MAG TPA: amidohydrolase family protein, partial [Myxococcota bacterium]